MNLKSETIQVIVTMRMTGPGRRVTRNGKVQKIGRKKKKKKKIERYRRRKHMEEKTAIKAHHMIGLGPIRQNSVDFFMTVTADYTLAKEMAVKEFLNEYLQFTEEEVENFVVIDTMTSKEQDVRGP